MKLYTRWFNSVTRVCCILVDLYMSFIVYLQPLLRFPFHSISSYAYHTNEKYPIIFLMIPDFRWSMPRISHITICLLISQVSIQRYLLRRLYLRQTFLYCGKVSLPTVRLRITRMWQMHEELQQIIVKLIFGNAESYTSLLNISLL